MSEALDISVSTFRRQSLFEGAANFVRIDAALKDHDLVKAARIAHLRPTAAPLLLMALNAAFMCQIPTWAAGRPPTLEPVAADALCRMITGSEEAK